jgi:ribose 5-phosphate isomerase B
VICLGGRVIGYELAWDLVQAFLGAQFRDTERYRRRLAEIAALESNEQAQ